MSDEQVIFWFRRDLRLRDNPALSAAARKARVIPVFILDEESDLNFSPGSASRWWLHHSLKSLDRSLAGGLRCFRGSRLKILQEICRRHGVREIYTNCFYEPWSLERDRYLQDHFQRLGIQFLSDHNSLLFKPGRILKGDGSFYRVFSPFYRQCLAHIDEIVPPLPSPERLPISSLDTGGMKIDDLDLLPRVRWDRSLEAHWKIGEEGAWEVLENFITHHLQDYHRLRDQPASGGVSRLSPYLHRGEISIRSVFDRTREFLDTQGGECFFKEICWREFAGSLLYQFPELPSKNLHSKFDFFPWKSDSEHLHAWQEGRTGFPFVDAGMRELIETGYMHNRVRMVVGSFLVKNLLLDWRLGQSWFADYLVDADLANNSFNWQWIAGCGADAAPYFRIFNPITQGEKFDPSGTYTRRFVPELENLDQKYLFAPWKAPARVLQEAGIELGKTYPYPVVDLARSRARALDSFASL